LSQSKEGEARVVENEREDKDNKEEMMAAEEEAMEVKNEDEDKSSTPAEQKKALNESTKSAIISQETNFTWEHFFVRHCGILRDDALDYETHLIGHRLSPEDTLLESLELIVKYGQIPIGDKFKIAKALEHQQDVLKSHNEHNEKTRKLLVLEGYNEIEAAMILDFAGGTSNYQIEYGIEQYYDARKELEKVVAVETLKKQDSKDMFLAGASAGRKACDPAMPLLHLFGYLTFD
jgi:hypothetical protein